MTKKQMAIYLVIIVFVTLFIPIHSYADSYDWMKESITIQINEETETYDFSTVVSYPNNYLLSSVYFYLPAKQTINIQICVDGTDHPKWYLYNDNGKCIGESNSKLWKYDKNTDTNVCSGWLDALNQGGYYIKFSEWYPHKTTKYIRFKINTYIPTATKITSIKSKNNTVTLKWNKAPGVEGYILYRSTSKKGKYKEIASVVGNKNKITIKKVKKNKSYYYKVLAYKTVNGKRVYSANSKVRKFKFKK